MIAPAAESEGGSLSLQYRICEKEKETYTDPVRKRKRHTQRARERKRKRHTQILYCSPYTYGLS